MRSTMKDKDTLAVLWVCDKRDCGKTNYRVLPKGHTIMTDECDYCKKTIREPLWTEVTLPEHQ